MGADMRCVPAMGLAAACFFWVLRIVCILKLEEGNVSTDLGPSHHNNSDRWFNSQPGAGSNSRSHSGTEGT